jgi:chorismate mutase
MPVMKSNARLYAVRGAVCCENTSESISREIPRMYTDILARNSISEDEIVSVLFSVTRDLTAMNPATALRLAGYGSAVPLFASAEPFVEGYLPGVIRVLVTFYGETVPVPVYLNGAEVLRPDLGKDAPENRSRV